LPLSGWDEGISTHRSATQPSITFLLNEIRQRDDRFSIKMALSRPWEFDGELSLNFEVNNKLVFVLSFTIVPGWVLICSRRGLDAAGYCFV
jgi:hypothetical protein